MIGRLALILSASVAAYAQTVVTVQNAASLGAGVPADALAPGSIAAVQTLRGGPVVINPDPAQLAVKLQPAGGAEMDMPVLGASLGTVLAIVPRAAPVGPATVRLINAGQASQATPVRIVATSPGLFATGQGGLGPALAQNASLGRGLELNRLTAPALPGDYLVLWGTGLGDARQDEVALEIGGIPAAAAYAGPAPGFPGLDQINVAVPPDAPRGCYVSVLLTVRGAVSNEVTVSNAATSGPCVHPFGLSAEALQALDEGRQVRLPVANLHSDVAPPPGGALNNQYTRNEGATAELAQRSAFQIALLAQPLKVGAAYYGCRLGSSLSLSSFIAVDDLDAGERLVLTGPDRSLDLVRSLPVLYTALVPAPPPVDNPRDLPAPFFNPGLWRLGGAGGATVASLEASLRLPPPIRWTNRGALAAIDRSAGFTVAWEPDGYSDDDVMTVTLTTGIFSQALPGTALASTVACRAPASQGQLTMPADLLQLIPPSPTFPGVGGGTLTLRLAPLPWRRTRFDLPYVAGGAAPGVFDYLFSEALRTVIR